MNQLTHTSPFDGIRHEDERGKEYWSAHELGKLLGYGEYRKFKNAIEKAEEACKNSDQAVAHHFVHVGGMIEVGKGARRKVEDVHLTRYACYLLVGAPVTGHQIQRGYRPLPLWEWGVLSA